MSETNEINTSAPKPKKFGKIGDLIADRVVAIVAGAVIPVVLLIIPVINKHQEDYQELQKLQIETNVADLVATKQSVAFLTQLVVTLSRQVEQLQSETSELKKGCDNYCIGKGKV